MPRILLPLLLAGALAGCAGPTYTIQAASLIDANERAQRYCALQDRTAELKGVEQQDGKAIEVYRCVPGPGPAPAEVPQTVM